MTNCDNNIDACYEFVYIMIYVCSDVCVALYMKILMYGSRKVGFAVFQKKGFPVCVSSFILRFYASADLEVAARAVKSLRWSTE